MQRLYDEWIRCEICDNWITTETSPKFWWEGKREEHLIILEELRKVDDSEDEKEYDTIKAVCNSCWETLKQEEKQIRLKMYHKQYWSNINAIFNIDNLLKLLVTIGLVVVFLIISMWIFGLSYLSESGYSWCL
ncbi:MAG TPA: hypothetical protein VMV49_18340 [Candidatus Deferrimicrobium sp.]|nr:hypothetical protein [Candidatus Deferrimicrobium sp.]